jgi:hypothetical protein
MSDGWNCDHCGQFYLDVADGAGQADRGHVAREYAAVATYCSFACFEEHVADHREEERAVRITCQSLESLGWLGGECVLDDGVLRLHGHLGRRRDEPASVPGDEQPLDASALIEAERAAFAAGGPEHGARAQQAFDWFLGRNGLGRPLYDFATGGGSDRLDEHDLNANEGAESTLAFHRAELVLDATGLPVVLRRRATRAKEAV